MPDVQEVFRIATQEVRPEAGFVDRQLDRQRRAARARRSGALVVAAAMALIAALLITRALPGKDTEPAAPPETNVSSTIRPPNTGGLTPDVALRPFTSSAYAYSFAYPQPWHAYPARRSLTQLGLPIDASPALDYFGIRGPKVETYPVLVVAAQPVEPGTTRRSWTSDVETFVDQCGVPNTKETVNVDGERATLAYFVGCYYPGKKGTYKYWITLVHGGMGYHVLWMGYEGNETLDRAVLDRILESFRFRD